ncbi:hypothetical protein BpHYR1_053017 [Brachionus plicatilis]|uniref:Uncharacterized protein n=1 Tax=Brachionus plicatilis TaxID=10195 RepID=A0A3M7SAP3_BRAPC|nr:hypothetical protein BpHYR1_053017 [Brachionus plicatilis]
MKVEKIISELNIVSQNQKLNKIYIIFSDIPTTISAIVVDVEKSLVIKKCDIKNGFCILFILEKNDFVNCVNEYKPKYSFCKNFAISRLFYC